MSGVFRADVTLSEGQLEGTTRGLRNLDTQSSRKLLLKLALGQLAFGATLIMSDMSTK